jgi:hypothetical protein
MQYKYAQIRHFAQIILHCPNKLDFHNHLKSTQSYERTI